MKSIIGWGRGDQSLKRREMFWPSDDESSSVIQGHSPSIAPWYEHLRRYESAKYLDKLKHTFVEVPRAFLDTTFAVVNSSTRPSSAQMSSIPKTSADLPPSASRSVRQSSQQPISSFSRGPRAGDCHGGLDDGR